MNCPNCGVELVLSEEQILTVVKIDEDETEGSIESAEAVTDKGEDKEEVV